MVRLSNVEIHRLVFRTFGLRRYTQDSPIQPDVWVRFLKLAARGRLHQRVSLILTPKETPGKDGRPSGGAALLAEQIRSRILGAQREQELKKLRGQMLFKPDEKLQAFRIASTTRHVVIEATYEQMFRYLLPLTAWWGTIDRNLRDTDALARLLTQQIQQGAKIRAALAQLDDTEFFRFAALTAIVRLIAQSADSAGEADIRTLIDKLAPADNDDEAGLDEEDEDDGSDVPRDESPDGGARRAPQDATVEEVDILWEHYRQMVDFKAPGSGEAQKSGGKAAAVSAEALIWSIQLNRVAARPATPARRAKPAASGGVLPLAVRMSRQTVKADAAAQLFSVTTADLAWAIVDTGIDATHDAFTRRAADSGKIESTRVITTLDFTRLRDLLAEEFDIDELVEAIPWDQATDPGSDPQRKLRVLATIDSIRRRNVNGRELDWSLLELLIRWNPLAAPDPVDPHGTHVAGILGGDLAHGAPDGSGAFTGICPDIGLYDLRVFHAGGSDEFTILAALDYINWLNRDPERPAIHGINLSLSLEHIVDAHACGRTPICDACNRLVSGGTVVVAAAGNFGFDPKQNKASQGAGYRGMSITDPGNADLVITVGATHRNDPHTYGVSYFSSRGPTGDGRLKPDLVAPGEKIRSTIPQNKMLVKDGTSMAAPHVSGVCAMLMARHREFIGQPKRIKEILLATATDLGRERYFQGAGLVDALRALQSV